MIQIEQIKAEIERLKDKVGIGLNEYDMGEENGKAEVLNQSLAFIDSLPAESASPELDAEIKRYQQEDCDRDTTIRDVAHHFVNWQKAQMEKNAVEGEVEISYNDDTALINCPFKCNTGDKVKLIILKDND